MYEMGFDPEDYFYDGVYISDDGEGNLRYYDSKEENRHFEEDPFFAKEETVLDEVIDELGMWDQIDEPA